MVTPDEIVKRAERKYHDVLRSWLSGEPSFPIEFPVGTLSKNLAERRQQIEQLREQSKAMCGSGYDLEWVTINSQYLGRQTAPRRVIIANMDDYLTLIRKRTEFNHFITDVQKLRQRFPALEHWLQAHLQPVIEHHGEWDDLLTVCEYFVRQLRPNVYIRELPIPVPTKFIEMNTHILRDLLDELLPSEWIDEDTVAFNRRFGLKDKPPLVRLCLLAAQLDRQYGLQLDDLSLPVEQVAHLLADHIKPKHVIIVENLINFLTLPKFPNSVGLFGGGFAIHLLRDVSWLLQCDVIYWGDIDAHGFQILSDLRSFFPHIRSVMMDRQTLEDNHDYVVPANTPRSERYDCLTDSESLLAQHVIEHGLRLEQEHIHHEYAVASLKRALLNTNST